MRHFLLCASGAALVFAPLSASAQESVEQPLSAEAQAVIDGGGGLNPTREWRITPRASGCTASQTFADEGQRVTFVMRRLQPLLEVQFAIIGSVFRQDDAMAAGFVPTGNLLEVTQANGANIGEREGFVFARHSFLEHPSMVDLEQFLGIGTEYFVIQGEGREPLVLNTGAVGEVFDQFNACTRTQLREYGVDWAIRGGFQRHPSVTNIREVIRDLGRAFGRERESIFARGPVTVRLIVDGDGNATRCDLITQMARRDLEEITCDVLMEDAEFEVALDAMGEPVTDFMFQQVTFVAVVPTNADGSL